MGKMLTLSQKLNGLIDYLINDEFFINKGLKHDIFISRSVMVRIQDGLFIINCYKVVASSNSEINEVSKHVLFGIDSASLKDKKGNILG